MHADRIRRCKKPLPGLKLKPLSNSSLKMHKTGMPSKGARMNSYGSNDSFRDAKVYKQTDRSGKKEDKTATD
jgi:hypothetical protein